MFPERRTIRYAYRLQRCVMICTERRRCVSTDQEAAALAMFKL